MGRGDGGRKGKVGMDVDVDGFGEGGDVEKKQLQSLSPDFFR